MLQRIAILSVHTSPIATPGGKKVGGMNTYIREISQALAKRGFGIDIYTRRISAEQPYIDESIGNGVRVIHVTAGPAAPLNPSEIYPYLQQFTAGVMAYTIRHQVCYNLIFSHYWLSGWVAQKLKESWGTPFIQMFHTLGHMKNRIPSVKDPVPELRTQTETKVVAWADLLIANTPAERSQLLWLYHADRRKIVVCPPGVNTARFNTHTSRQTMRQQLGLLPDHDLLLFAGRIEPLKAVDTILDALYHIKLNQPETLSNTQLAIIGGNPKDASDRDMANLIRQTNAQGLTPYVSFLGAKDQDTLAQYYTAASAVLMPSEYESFGMVALEAMASGTPVIASEVGGLAYLVRDGETGYLVPARSPDDLADRITRLVNNPTLQNQLGTHGASLAKSYDWDIIASRLEDIFKETFWQNNLKRTRAS